jgi:hypothetical protein
MDFTRGQWNSRETEWRIPVFHFQSALQGVLTDALS